MTKSFRGEGDLMVDALVAASKEAFNQGGGQPMPGYGRDLVPFFDGGDVAPLAKPAGGGRVNGAVQPPPPPTPDTAGADILAMLNGHAPAPPTPAAPPAPAPAKAKKAKKAPAKANPPAPKISLPNGFTYEVQQPDPALAKAAKKRTKGQEKSSGPPPPTAAQRWAGPSFQSSPAPDALPVPAFMKGAAAPGGGTSAGTKTAEAPVDGGADIMAMLCRASASAQAPPKEASAPDLMAMLNITPEEQPPARQAPQVASVHKAASAPARAPAHKSAARGSLLTPDMLAAMTNAPPPPSAAAAARDRSSKLLSMRARAPAAPIAHAGGSAEFLQLMRKLEQSSSA
jgi:hypothetical protein